ncbi:MAG: carbohydrate ABC transporter permease [Thermomicrobiales bacterium]|nr:carbohydrate ABC transporter permease [Thermomicrobiales bacterium]
MATQAAMSGTQPIVAARAPSYRPPRRIKWGTVLRHVVLAVFAMVILLPIIWVLLLSVKSLPDAYQNDIWPKTFDFSHYGYSLQRIPTLPQNYANSIIVTLGTVVITTVCAVLAGYAMVFLNVPGITIVFAVLVASMFFPTRVTAVIAIFEIQKDLGLLNVPAGLIFPYVTLSLALSVFVMRGMFQTVPREIYDAATIDGSGRMRTLLSIMVPMVKNGIVVVIIVNFVTAWGEYLLAKTLNTNQSAQTLPVMLSMATGGMGAWVWPRLAAVYVMAITPGLIAFGLAQRWYIKGLQEGALKA